MKWLCFVLTLSACVRGGFGADDASAALTSCGTTLLLDDGFEDGQAAPHFTSFADDGLTVREEGSSLQIVFDPTVAAKSWAGYRSVADFPADGLCAAIDVSRLPEGEGALFLRLESGDQAVEFYAHGGWIELRTKDGTRTHVVTALPAQLMTYGHWRLRQAAGVTHWETSTDGLSYTSQAEASFLAASKLALALGAGTFETLANGGYGRITGVQVVGR